MEDDVGRDAALARDPQADGAQAIEEIVIDVLPGLGIGPRRAPDGGPSSRAAGAPAPGPAWRPRPSAARRPASVSASTGILVVGLPQQPFGADLLDVAADLRHRRVLQQPERAQLLVPAFRDLLALAAAQDVGDVGGAEALADARDARQDLARDDDRRRSPPRARRGSSRRRRSRPCRSARRNTTPGAGAGSRRRTA